MLFKVAAVLPLLSLVAAQDYGGSSSGSGSGSGAAAQSADSSSPSSTGSASGAVQTVKVGENGGVTFSPNKITAAVGDKVEFQFFPVTHSVAQAAFDAPCVPSGDTAFFSGGITSGPKSGKRQASTDITTFTVTVNDTKPIWFYCAFPGHCEAGMVGVINQADTGNKTIEAFAEAAANVGKSVAPSVVQGGVMGTTSSSGSSSSGTSTNSAAPSTSTGAAAGLMEKGSYGTVVAAGLVATLAGLVGTLLV